MTRRHEAAAGEAGMTLPEILIAMTLSMIVLFAGLTSFQVFDRNVARTSSLNDAEDSARRDVADIVSTLRSAGAPAPTSGAQPTAVTHFSALDIVFLSTSWPGESAIGSTGHHIERYCVNTTTRELWFDGLRAGTVGAANPGAACPTVASGWTHRRMATGVENDATRPLFRNAATPVRGVGVSLRLRRGNTVASGTLQLGSGTALRGALASTIGAGDVGVICDYDGSGKALLSVGTNLKLAASGAVQLGPGKILVDAGASSSLALTVTNVLGLQTLLFKEVSCP